MGCLKRQPILLMYISIFHMSFTKTKIYNLICFYIESVYFIKIEIKY